MPGEASRANGRKGGRPRGAVNKATAEVRLLACQHTPDAIATLVHLMKRGQSEAARIMAARELLDRGHGKPREYHDVTHHTKPDLSRLNDAELAALEAIVAKAVPVAPSEAVH